MYLEGTVWDRPQNAGVVLVDGQEHTIRSWTGFGYISSVSDEDTITELSPSRKAQLGGFLRDHTFSWPQESVDDWGRRHGARVGEGWVESSYSSWYMVICAADYSIHGFGSQPHRVWFDETPAYEPPVLMSF